MEQQSSKEGTNAVLQNEQKSIRHRKRNFYNQIREQMEFYFGDANLSKDRFLMQLIKKDCYVPLDIFLKFNKLKKLTQSVDDIATSLSNSKLLQLNEEKTCVCRILPLVENRDADSKTIYVEGLPPSADHDWVKKVFTQMSGGTVSYVSLPKYKKSRKIKEFGFVEFDNESSVEKCIQAFQKFDGVLCTTTVDPAKLTSVQTFVEEEKIEKASQSKESTEQTEETSETESDSADSSKNNAKKTAAVCESDQSRSNVAGGNAAANMVSSEEPEDAITEEDVKTKKRKRKRKKMHKTERNQPLNMESDIRELKILQKKDWKRLRNKYLNMQREVIAEMKRKAWEKSGASRAINPKQSKDSKLQTTPTTTATATSLLPNLQKYEIIKSPHHMNFYGTGDNKLENPPEPKRRKLTAADCDYNIKQVDENKRNPAAEKPLLFKYECGIIVNISFLEACVDVKAFKADMKQYEFVKYVDVKEGALDAHIRCDSNKTAHQLCKQVQSAEMNCKIITGEQEKQYWDKILRDREMKLNKSIKVKGKRGREKITKLVANHVRFGDDDE